MDIKLSNGKKATITATSGELGNPQIEVDDQFDRPVEDEKELRYIEETYASEILYNENRQR